MRDQDTKRQVEQEIKMKAHFIGSRVHVQSETGAALLLSAQDMIQLVQWGLDNEVALRDRANEADKAKEQATMKTGGGDEE